MTIQGLIELSKDFKFTEEDKERIRVRFRELEEEFERQAKSMILTPELLNRTYTL